MLQLALLQMNGSFANMQNEVCRKVFIYCQDYVLNSYLDAVRLAPSYCSRYLLDQDSSGSPAEPRPSFAFSLSNSLARFHKLRATCTDLHSWQ